MIDEARETDWPIQRPNYYPKKQSSRDEEKHLKTPPTRAKRKEIEGQAILTSELLTMERQTKPPINPKTNAKEKGEKIRKLPWLVSTSK